MNFQISYEFAEKYLRFSNADFIKFYLYAKYLADKNGSFPSPEVLAKDLDLTFDRTKFILDFWVSRDEIIKAGNSYSFPNTKLKKTPSAKAPINTKKVSRPSYSMKEIDTVAATNKSISGLFYQAETVLNKILSQSDMEMLYSFVDWLGLPVEVITMLLSYASKKGKTGRRYLETVAIDWAERGIDTFEAAEAYVMELEAIDSAERKIRNILGIYDRALTATEKKYISAWCEDERISMDLIPIAYDRTVVNTGKLSLAYMNKILLTWAEEGFKKPEDVNTWDGNIKKSKKPLPKKGKLNNYNDTNKTDYSALEEELLEMFLDQEV